MPKSSLIAFKVTPVEAAALKARAQEDGMTVSEVMRRFLAEYLHAPQSPAQDSLIEVEEYKMTG